MSADAPQTDSRILVPIHPASIPHLPLILCDEKFIQAVEAAEQRVGALAISDAGTLQSAANLLQELTTSAKQLEAMRIQLKKPSLDWGSRIDAAAKAPAIRIDNLKRKVMEAMTRFATAERQRAEKLEQERQAEIKKLEAEAERQRLAAKAKADEEAAKRGPVDLDFDEEAPVVEVPKTVIEQKIEALKFAPAVAAPKPTGVRFGVKLVAKIVSVAKLPDAYVNRTANEALIRATYCTGYKEGMPIPECPGVVFTVEQTTASSGRTSELV